ncbi:hypothetical protein RRG08_058825 [Elysia crispata]|uniref:AIG1-type G domain-containing protein n=1 Tax=Elysia crispata TaxID=231223 RepID=A0AAE1DY95_9GAST|nr:hypothetical protein RRG08_058825 [Elysia crispata]
MKKNITCCQTLGSTWIKYGSNFDADIKFLKDVKKTLGKEYVEKHIILLMTNIDTFKTESENRFTFEQWCERQTGAFRTLMEECGNRIVPFDNMTGDDHIKTTQRDGLFALATELALQRQYQIQTSDLSSYILFAVSVLINCIYVFKNLK